MNHILKRLNNAVLNKELAPDIIFLPFESNNEKISTFTGILHLTFIIFKTFIDGLVPPNKIARTNLMYQTLLFVNKAFLF